MRLPWFTASASIASDRSQDTIVATGPRAWPQGKSQGSVATSRKHLGKEDSAQDLFASKTGSAPAGSQRHPLEYHLYAIFSGHREGVAAAQFCGRAVVDLLEAHLPPPPQATRQAQGEWEGELQGALLRTVLGLQRGFAATGATGGCSATLVLEVGQLLTCATVGKTCAVILTAGPSRSGAAASGLALSRDHRVGSNALERRRLARAGALVAAWDAEGGGPAPAPGRGRGCLRLWPGGITVARAIGDFSVGEALLPLPHIRQVRLPASGGRLLLTSCPIPGFFGDGAAAEEGPATALAGSPPSREALQLARTLLDAPISGCPALVQGVVGRPPLGFAKEASVVVVDVQPPRTKGSALERRTGDGDGMRLGCALRSLFRRATGRAPTPPSTHQADASEGPNIGELVSDVDTARILGLTLDPPLPEIPSWCGLRVISDTHLAMKQARTSWQAARRAHAAAAELQALQGVGLHSGMRGSGQLPCSSASMPVWSGSRGGAPAAVAAGALDGPSGWEHAGLSLPTDHLKAPPAAFSGSGSGSGSRRRRKGKDAPHWLAAYDSRLSHYRRSGSSGVGRGERAGRTISNSSSASSRGELGDVGSLRGSSPPPPPLALPAGPWLPAEYAVAAMPADILHTHARRPRSPPPPRAKPQPPPAGLFAFEPTGQQEECGPPPAHLPPSLPLHTPVAEELGHFSPEGGSPGGSASGSPLRSPNTSPRNQDAQAALQGPTQGPRPQRQQQPRSLHGRSGVPRSKSMGSVPSIYGIGNGSSNNSDLEEPQGLPRPASSCWGSDLEEAAEAAAASSVLQLFYRNAESKRLGKAVSFAT